MNRYGQCVLCACAVSVFTAHCSLLAPGYRGSASIADPLVGGEYRLTGCSDAPFIPNISRLGVPATGES